MDPIIDNKDVAKKSGNGGLITGIIIVLIIAAGGWYYFKGSSQNTNPYQVPVTMDTSTTTATNTNTTPTLMVSTGQLLTASQNYKNSYEVYPDLDPVNGTKALSGFSMEKQDLGGGVTQITLVAKQSNYRTQAFIIGPGQKLYFVERAFGDDSIDNDENTGDDMGMVVDAQGYILK